MSNTPETKQTPQPPTRVGAQLAEVVKNQKTCTLQMGNMWLTANVLPDDSVVLTATSLEAGAQKYAEIALQDFRAARPDVDVALFFNGTKQTL